MGLMDKLMQVVKALAKCGCLAIPIVTPAMSVTRISSANGLITSARLTRTWRSALARMRSARMASRTATPLNTKNTSSANGRSGPTVLSVGQTSRDPATLRRRLCTVKVG